MRSDNAVSPTSVKSRKSGSAIRLFKSPNVRGSTVEVCNIEIEFWEC